MLQGGSPLNRRIGRGKALKVTIDSSEPLADAIRVLGALYDVTLVTSTTEAAEEAPVKNTSRTTAARRKQLRRAATEQASPAVSKRTRAPRSTDASADVGAADLRAWARENGYTVSDRGRVAASVVAAYQQAHSS